MHAATLLSPHEICPLNLLPIIHEVHARAGDFPGCVTLTTRMTVVSSRGDDLMPGHANVLGGYGLAAVRIGPVQYVRVLVQVYRIHTRMIHIIDM